MHNIIMLRFILNFTPLNGRQPHLRGTSGWDPNGDGGAAPTSKYRDTGRFHPLVTGHGYPAIGQLNPEEIIGYPAIGLEHNLHTSIRETTTPGVIIECLRAFP
jgi:hypothetical protein